MNGKIEKEAAGILNQDPFKVKIDDHTFYFNRLSLSDRERISALVATLPSLDATEDKAEILSQAIRCGKYSSILAHIIVVASKPKSNWPVFRKLDIFLQKRRLRKVLLNNPVSMRELHDIFLKIIRQISPAFFWTLLFP